MGWIRSLDCCCGTNNPTTSFSGGGSRTYSEYFFGKKSKKEEEKRDDDYETSRALKTIQKKGLGKYAKSLGVDLNKL